MLVIVDLQVLFPSHPLQILNIVVPAVPINVMHVPSFRSCTKKRHCNKPVHWLNIDTTECVKAYLEVLPALVKRLFECVPFADFLCYNNAIQCSFRYNPVTASNFSVT